MRMMSTDREGRDATPLTLALGNDPAPALGIEVCAIGGNGWRYIGRVVAADGGTMTIHVTDARNPLAEKVNRLMKRVGGQNLPSSSKEIAMKWSDFESRIKPEMLNGRAFTLTIKNVTTELVLPKPGQPKEAVPILSFIETDKTLVLNATNRRALARAFGDDAINATGKKITLTPCTNNTSRGKQPGIAITPAAQDTQLDEPEPPAAPAIDRDTEPAEMADGGVARALPAAPATPAATLDAHFGPKPERKSQTPAKPQPGSAPAAANAARAKFYQLSSEAIRSGALTTQAVNGLVRAANGDGFEKALEMLEAALKGK